MLLWGSMQGKEANERRARGVGVLVWVVVRVRLWDVVPSEHDVMNVRERVMGEGGPLMVLNK